MTTHTFNFTPSQRKKLIGITAEKPITVLLKPAQLVDGSSRLKVSKPIKTKIQKHIQQGKGIRLTFQDHQMKGKGIGLSVNVPKKLRVPKSAHNKSGDGFFGNLLGNIPNPKAQAASVAIGLGEDILESAGDNDRIAGILNRRIKQLSGKGLNPATDTFIAGIMQAAKVAASEAAKQGKKPSEMTGDGAFKDFAEGFIFGLNPANWGTIAKAGIAEIDAAIEGKGIATL